MKKWFAAALVCVVAANAADDSFVRQKTLELLDTYCPDGSKILRMCIPLYPEISATEFTIMIDGSDEKACLRSINTIVHEENHTTNTFTGRDVLKNKFGKFSEVFYDYDYFYLKDGNFSLMRRTETFPAIETVPEFPERLRTFRFGSYINTQNTIQSTQIQGIYGLLDEMNSYYQGTKAAFDLLGYYEKKGKNADWHDYFGEVNSTYYGCLEFRLYILKYLIFAKKYHPDIYQGLLNNKALCWTFLEVDRNISDLLQAYANVKPVLFKRLKGYGWSVYEDAINLSIEINGRTTRHTNFMDVIELLTEEMKKSEYISMLQTLEEHAAGWEPDDIYAEVDAAMKGIASSNAKYVAVNASAPQLKKRERMDEVVNLTDPKGDTQYPFVDLLGASVSKDGEGLIVRMDLAKFSEQLTFCQKDVPENNMEYQWSVMFDIEGDGTDDYSIELSNFKPPESDPIKGDPLDVAQLTIWELNNQGGQASNVLFHGGRVGNKLIFDVPMCDFVASIGPKTQIRFVTYYTNGSIEDSDQMPE